MADQTEFSKQLADWLAAVPRADRRTLHAWAKAAGVTPNVVYRLRSGEHKAISPRNLERLAAAASVPAPAGADRE